MYHFGTSIRCLLTNTKRINVLTNDNLIELLQFGKVTKFNQFRADNPAFEIDLSGAYLAYINLNYANLSGAYLKGTIFRGANLKSANLKGAMLPNAILEGADLRGAILQGVYMNHIDLGGAILDKQQISMLPELLGIKVMED